MLSVCHDLVNIIYVNQLNSLFEWICCFTFYLSFSNKPFHFLQNLNVVTAFTHIRNADNNLIANPFLLSKLSESPPRPLSILPSLPFCLEGEILGFSCQELQVLFHLTFWILLLHFLLIGCFQSAYRM